MSAKRTTTWLAATVALVGGFEGLRTAAYRDPVGIPTVCFGETRNVRMGDRHTVEECKAMLGTRLQEFESHVAQCVRVDLPDTRRAALVSLAYNIGPSAFCKSTVVRKLNAGDTRGACNAILAWNKAGGIPLPGLTRRRQAERDLCMENL